MATEIAFDIDVFRAQFPGQFPDPPYTDSLIEATWNVATCYVSDNDTSCFLSTDCRRVALNLMTAHLLALNIAANSAGNPTLPQGGFVDSSSIGKISVSVQTFDTKSEFVWWLNQTAYGQQLASLLKKSSVGGFYIGGYNELGSFRRAGGRFIPA